MSSSHVMTRGHGLTLRSIPWTGLLIAVAAIVLLVAGGLMTPLLLSALAAYLLNPSVTYLESKGLGRTWATLTVFVIILVVLFGLGLLFYPGVLREIQSIQGSASQSSTEEMVSKLESGIREHLGFLGLEQFNLSEKIQEAKTWVSGRLLDFVITDLPSLIADLIVIPFIAFFLLKDGREMKKLLISRVPNRYFEFSLNLLYRMDKHLSSYLTGQFLDALCFGVIAAIALWMLDVRYPVFLGAFAGLANLIPYVGIFVGGLVSALTSFLDVGDLSKVVQVLGAFVVIKLIDDVILQPLTVAKSVEMHPLVVVIVVIISGNLFGILGMLLSVPVVGFVKIVVEEIIIVYRNYDFR